MKRWCGCGPGDDLSVGAELPLSGVAAVALALTGAPVEAGKPGMFLGSRGRWSHGAVPGMARRPLRESPFPDGGCALVLTSGLKDWTCHC